MSQFEFIAVLVSIVVGLGVVRLLSGMAQLLDVGDKAYWVHVVWTWNIFQFLVFFWWFFWRLSIVTEWTLILFLFVLIYAVALYMLCAILYPAAQQEENFEDIYFARKKWFFGLLAITMIIDIIDTNWKAALGLEGFGVLHLYLWGTIFVGSVVAAKTDSRRYHEIWAVLFLLMMSTFEYINFGTLRAD